MTMMFDYSRKMDRNVPDRSVPDRIMSDKNTPDKNVPGKSVPDKNASNVRPQQWYHTRLFLGNQISREMELFFRDLYDKYGDFHIVDLSVLNGNQVLLVYSIPCYR